MNAFEITGRLVVAIGAIAMMTYLIMGGAHDFGATASQWLRGTQQQTPQTGALPAGNYKWTPEKGLQPANSGAAPD